MLKLIDRLFKRKPSNDTTKENLFPISRERSDITNSIINVLNNTNKELHHKEIYDKIKHNNYDHKKFISVIYYLAKKHPEQIKYGKNKGCFAINIREWYL